MRLPGGGELAAYAAYLFAPRDGGLDVFFDEAPLRLFQSFALYEDGDVWRGESQHLCAPDQYCSRLAVYPHGGWSLDHTVTGPRKGYISQTSYRRADEPHQQL